MPLQSIRWKVTEAIRRTLLSSRRDGFVVRTYRVLRNTPGVRWVWRRIDRGEAVPWLDMDFYTRIGGRFKPENAPSSSTRSPPPPFEDDSFFDDLLLRISQDIPARPPKKGLCVLVNNGLSAGGAERQIVYTLRGLTDRGMPVSFVGEYLGMAPGLDFHAASLTDAGMDVRPLRRRPRSSLEVYKGISREVAHALMRFPPHVLTEILDMVDELTELRPSIVHLWQDETSIKHGISALLAGVPRIILSGRNLNPTHFGYHLPYMRNAYRALASHPAVVLSNNSHAGAASYASWLEVDVSRIHVVHNGLDVDCWPVCQPSDIAKWRESHRIRSTQALILGVMRLSQEKRPLLWLDVAAKVCAVAPDVRFAIAGDGPLKPEVVRRIAELGLAGYVTLLGEIPQISAAIAAADVVMLVSEQEGLPNVLLEAQWYGRPCLATDAGGAREAVRDGVTGVIVKTDAVNDIAAALVCILQDGDIIASASREGPRFIRETFGLTRMIDETIVLYGGTFDK